MALSLARFQGKVAVVTGASSGIGKDTAKALVKNGLIVAGLGRRVERIEDLAKQLSGEKGKLKAYKCDMTKEQDILSTFKRITEELGPIHVLVNNAGLMLPTTLIDGDTEKWRTTFDTNVLGLCIATREALKSMKAHNTAGHIIHINSIAGHYIVDIPNMNVYSGTKYAVTALAETLRRDLTREKLPIKITSVSPGYVETEIQAVAGFPADAISMPALNASDIAEAVVYALSTPAHVNINEITLQAVGS
ncbi:farnesol dehydrogenase-like [Rhynchophorus ferrugineus]|uniref:farnesol dehydrogenase-like n=1 Tax=Rhynchophorus ferrugineus TaxID=354439 RepID=UPI003FCDC26B